LIALANRLILLRQKLVEMVHFIYPIFCIVVGGPIFTWVAKHWYDKYQLNKAKRNLQKGGQEIVTSINQAILQGNSGNQFPTEFLVGALLSPVQMNLTWGVEPILKNRWREKHIYLASTLGLTGLISMIWGLSQFF
jgi:hypothetical protein